MSRYCKQSTTHWCKVYKLATVVKQRDVVLQKALKREDVLDIETAMWLRTWGNQIGIPGPCQKVICYGGSSDKVKWYHADGVQVSQPVSAWLLGSSQDRWIENFYNGKHDQHSCVFKYHWWDWFVSLLHQLCDLHQLVLQKSLDVPLQIRRTYN